LAIIEQGQLIISGSMEDIRQRASHERLIRIRAIQPPTEVKVALTHQQGVGDIRVQADQVELDYSGDDENLAALLDHLLESGIKVVSFTDIDDDLEDLFMRLTKGEVA
jgi:ABC-2 type transport system ATP-binding protein